jgi:hypothetical protein
LRFCAEKGVSPAGMESLETLVEESIFSRKDSQEKPPLKNSAGKKRNPEPVLSEVEEWLRKH